MESLMRGGTSDQNAEVCGTVDFAVASLIAFSLRARSSFYDDWLHHRITALINSRRHSIPELDYR